MFCVGGAGEGVALWEVESDCFCSACGKRVESKLSKPKGSIVKNLQFYKKFQAKILKSAVFSIALIDKLIYNRICVSIVG